jgi:hypothetical protein
VQDEMDALVKRALAAPWPDPSRRVSEFAGAAT